MRPRTLQHPVGLDTAAQAAAKGPLRARDLTRRDDREPEVLTCSLRLSLFAPLLSRCCRERARRWPRARLWYESRVVTVLARERAQPPPGRGRQPQRGRAEGTAQLGAAL